MLNRKNRLLRAVCLLAAVLLGMTSLAMPTSAEKEEMEHAAAPISLIDIEMPVSADCPAAQVHYYARTGSFCVGLLENGRKVEILDQYGDFYRIDCYGCRGYIAKEHIQDDGLGNYYVQVNEEAEDALMLQTYAASEVEEVRAAVCGVAHRQIGYPYVFGGQVPGGFDCSGLVYYVFNRTTKLSLPRTATPQFSEGIIVDPQEALPGDLVFFWGTDGSSSIITHVGIYIGNNQFIHASTSKGISIASLDNSYWSYRVRGIRRMLVPASSLWSLDLTTTRMLSE